ncbi:hypothetical protein NDU88_005598 [Pleurodeles waltl]|uniref:Uncharacterized protein n=1 Tax=Pleurodeles waltl TaxID=8319 RepID=A0AAV7NMV5_PLEWA|nr:hypothetical protein NDU88_005598 [Pleurodeles waltl]
MAGMGCLFSGTGAGRSQDAAAQDSQKLDAVLAAVEHIGNSLLSKARAERLSLLERLRRLNYAAHSARTHASADKSGKLLAWLVRGDRDHGPIMEVRSEAGGLLHRPGEIHSAFKQHCQALYDSRALSPERFCNEFLVSVELPCLTADQGRTLLVEIQASIRELESGKTPGPNGLPADFYKAFTSILAPKLLRVYEEAVRRGCLTTSQWEALLVSLPKPVKFADINGLVEDAFEE